MKIYLASKSPRRKELLQQMEVEFELLPNDTPEIVNPHETAETYSKRIIQEKLNAAWETILKSHLAPRPVLCADTEVILDGRILGKPNNAEEAFQMLKSYSGKTHEVMTIVGLKHGDYQKIEINRTFITFSTISPQEITHYLAMGDYKDKAGGYGIQSYIGQFISHIEGCFYSVMGLPLNTVKRLLEDCQAHFTVTQ